MTGFYGEMVYWVHSRVFVQEERFWVVLEVVGTRYRVQTGGFVGILGWMVVTVVNPMMLVASWKRGGVLGWFFNPNVV